MGHPTTMASTATRTDNPMLRDYSRTEASLVGSWSRVAMLLRDGPNHPQTVNHLSEAVEDLLSASDEPTALLGVIRANANPPDAVARQRLAELVARMGRRGVGCAVVYHGSALRRAVIGSVAAGINLLTRAPFPQHVFGDLTQASQWLAQRLDTAGTPTDPYALEAAALELARRFDDREG